MFEKLKKKNPILMSTLITTGGFFIAKMIGLLYSMPFSYILGSDELMSYYGASYRIYSYLLNIFTAGIPFAIATLVARYSTMEQDTKTEKLRKISVMLSVLLGVMGAVLMYSLAGLLAPILCGDGTGTETMVTCLGILSLALLFVPLLSAMRGYIQGRKEMGEYAFSQSFEQIFRVCFLLSVSCLGIYLLGWDRKYALYAGVLSTSVAAVAGIGQVYWFNRSTGTLKIGVSWTEAIKDKGLWKELILLSFPYLLSAIVGYSDDIMNTTILPVALKANGLTSSDFDTTMAAVNYVGLKLTAIPMILAPGFTSSIIPHITENITKGDTKAVQENIDSCLRTVFYIATFLTVCIILYAKPLYTTIFRTDNLSLAARTVQFCAIEGWFCTIVPVISSLTMTCGFRGILVKRQAICAGIKGITMYPLVLFLGFPGAVLSTAIAFGWLAIVNCELLRKKYGLKAKTLLKTGIILVVGLSVMWIAYTVLDYIMPMVSGDGAGYLVSIGINGIVSVCVFGLVTYIMIKLNR